MPRDLFAVHPQLRGQTGVPLGTAAWMLPAEARARVGFDDDRRFAATQITPVGPGREAAVMKDQGLPCSLDLVMNANASIRCKRHSCVLPRRYV